MPRYLAKKMDRRTFSKASAAGVAAAMSMTAARAERVSGANERIRVGMMGVGNRGRQLLAAFLDCPDAEVVAICDVFKPHLAQAAEKIEGEVDQYGDFRKMIDRTDIDAVVIATPDHWHAIPTIAACKAGKDVYVEKPLSHTVLEGRRMVEAARNNKRIVQVGTNRRSSELWQKTASIAKAGDIGKITVSRSFRLANMFPGGIGKLPTSATPADLDWDMWLGPRPMRPYQDNIAPYKYHWWKNYSSQMANWGVHYLDVVRWCIDQQAPRSICAMGGVYAVDDDRSIPDTAQAMFEFASGHLALFGQYEASGNSAMLEGEVELRGTQGTLYAGEGWNGSERGIRIVPERGGQFQGDHSPRMEPVEDRMDESYHAQTVAHAQNFLDCIKSRELPTADVEIGHRSTTMANLANISLAVRSRLEWDAEQEVVTNVPEANDLLHYEYREPWTL